MVNRKKHLYGIYNYQELYDIYIKDNVYTYSSSRDFFVNGKYSNIELLKLMRDKLDAEILMYEHRKKKLL